MVRKKLFKVTMNGSMFKIQNWVVKKCHRGSKDVTFSSLKKTRT